MNLWSLQIHENLKIKNKSEILIQPKEEHKLKNNSFKDSNFNIMKVKNKSYCLSSTEVFFSEYSQV